MRKTKNIDSQETGRERRISNTRNFLSFFFREHPIQIIDVISSFESLLIINYISRQARKNSFQFIVLSMKKVKKTKFNSLFCFFGSIKWIKGFCLKKFNKNTILMVWFFCFCFFSKIIIILTNLFFLKKNWNDKWVTTKQQMKNS